MYINMPSLLQRAKELGRKVVVCPMHEYWLDVGNPNSLEVARLNYQA